jgi:hypothetical protein
VLYYCRIRERGVMMITLLLAVDICEPFVTWVCCLLFFSCGGGGGGGEGSIKPFFSTRFVHS